MKRLTVSFGVAMVAAVAMTGLLAVGSSTVLAQENPFLGTWVLNVAKSKHTPGPPPKEQTVINEAAGAGMRTTAKGVDPSGKPLSVSFTSTFDGKDHPVTGNPDWDSNAYTRVDSHTLQVTRKKAGKVVQTGTNVVSKDGKTRTVTVTGVNAQGQKINNVSVYEKN